MVRQLLAEASGGVGTWGRQQCGVAGLYLQLQPPIPTPPALTRLKSCSLQLSQLIYLAVPRVERVGRSVLFHEPFARREGLQPRFAAGDKAQADLVRREASGRSPHKAACSMGKGLSLGICCNFQSKGTEHHWVDTPYDTQELSAAC